MEKSVETLVQELIDASQGHDWFFEYADDYSTWSRGNEQRKLINSAFCALDDVDDKLSVETWNRVAPARFHFRPRAIL